MDEDIEGDVGPLDVTALEEIRAELLTLDGLIDHVGFDSLLDPTELQPQQVTDAGACGSQPVFEPQQFVRHRFFFKQPVDSADGSCDVSWLRRRLRVEQYAGVISLISEQDKIPVIGEDNSSLIKCERQYCLVINTCTLFGNSDHIEPV